MKFHENPFNGSRLVICRHGGANQGHFFNFDTNTPKRNMVGCGKPQGEERKSEYPLQEIDILQYTNWIE
jgi:hypothetical protein